MIDHPKVLPLGVFGVIAGQRKMEQMRSRLQELTNAITRADRKAVSNYLRSAPIVFAIMEHTWDVLERAFDVAGGSAILTDGTYYWRYDAADYVSHYGIALPPEFLERGRRSGWRLPLLSEEQILAIDDYLQAYGQRLQDTL